MDTADKTNRLPTPAAEPDQDNTRTKALPSAMDDEEPTRIAEDKTDLLPAPAAPDQDNTRTKALPAGSEEEEITRINSTTTAVAEEATRVNAASPMDDEATKKVADLPTPPQSAGEDSDGLQPGHLLLWYRIEKVLGQGGFGITYKALDTRLNNHVAIKEYFPSQIAKRQRDTLRLQPISPSYEKDFIHGRQRFLDEGRTLAKFKHPNLVRVAAFFEELNTAFMVMEYEQGRSLGDRLGRSNTMPEPELLKVVMPLLDGLKALHNAGYIHRDIKPDNIFIRDHDGSPVLLDFGAARKASGDNVKASMTTILTPGYAPIEQYFDNASRQGPWTDIYAMGAVMYRAISGKKPMGSPQRSDALMRQQVDPLLPAMEVGKDRYSTSLLKAIDMAMVVVEQNRPKSIPDWLNACNDGESSGMDQPKQTAESESFARPQEAAPRKRLLAMLGLSLTLLAGGAGYFYYGAGGQKGPAQESSLQLWQTAAAKGDTAAMLSLAEAYEKGQQVARDNLLAMEWLQKAATGGSGPAALKLGRAYQSGKTVAMDGQEAVKWLQMAAEKGEPDAQYLLWEAFTQGKGVAADAGRADSWLEKAAAGHQPQAMHSLGWKYLQGEGVARDRAQAMIWLEKAAQKGVARSQYLLFTLLVENPDDAAAKARAGQYLRQAAAAGDGQAQYTLAQQFAKGEGVAEDLAAAAHWYQQAADQGHPEAAVALAQAFEQGQGVVADHALAQKYYRQAAEAGSMQAQLALGAFYLTKFAGKAANPVEAVTWLRKAALQGSPDGQYSLGVLYANGTGVPKDLTEAMAWYGKAAATGHAAAENALGQIYEQGQGVPRDYGQAFQWYEKAAGHGFREAMTNAGWLYEDGRGVAKDYAKAAAWYKKAAELGDLRAQNTLGWMYEVGRGVEKNLVLAVAWYTMAVAQNDPDALKNLQLLTKDMRPAEIQEGQNQARKWQQAKGAAKP